MKKVLVLLVLLIPLFLLSPSPITAAPGATMSITANRRYVNLRFTGLKEVSKVSYTLTYDTTRGQKGFAGGLRPARTTRTSTRRQLLGTSSSGYNSYHTGIKNIQLTVTYTLRSGGTTTSSQVLQ